MTPSAPPLITRIRRRMASMAWLLAVLVLAKAGFAAACLADGPSAAPVAISVAAVVDNVAAAAPLDGDTGLCWHAGLNGCHCSCVHVSAIVPGGWQLTATPPPAMPIASEPPAIVIGLRDDHLRPPIA
ncbi:hypothetical protein DFR29_12414 [Tahibacter aquaticus]|uniref:DUF2946 family protein n=1 Tax=Tahibacter aquaticus TaxID=520092 RepID=A0A4R6YL07_9GAMM|nr:hypothetical protein [Tahibacter aquaticus]TDR37717.1 hypothetical protein DFR29_12414 [Tahibacter aquaticus]